MLGLTTRRLGWASLARRAHSTAAPKALDAETIAIIKATAPVLAEHGYAITSAMYGKMLSENPDVKSMFNLSHQVPHKGEKLAQQPHALACSVHAYAANIDNLGVLAEAVERIAQKHVSLQVFQEHYPVVGANLLWAIKHVLGDAATPEIMGAWERAYGTLADILVAREEEIRTSKAAQPGGWEGWRDFEVVDKVQESTEIASFYLKPVDGGDLMDYLPGSYTSIRVDTLELKSQRNYTLSKAASNDTWRITVKRESPADGAPVGVVSNWLHNEVDVGSVLKLGVPCGDFVLKLENDKPVVFLGAGVGITPLVAMADYLLHQTKATNKIFMVTSSRCPEVEAMHDTFEAYGRKHLNFYLKSIYDEASNDLYTGQINADVLESVLPSKDNNFYVCGPPGFMNATLGVLREWKVPENQIHHEYFGPPQ